MYRIPIKWIVVNISELFIGNAYANAFSVDVVHAYWKRVAHAEDKSSSPTPSNSRCNATSYIFNRYNLGILEIELNYTVVDDLFLYNLGNLIKV